MRLTTLVTKGCLALMVATPLCVLGCVPQRKCDLAVRERVFFGCLEKLPKGPSSLTAAGNDYDEAILECRVTADEFACDDGGW
jgi:hypothetical protein